MLYYSLVSELLLGRHNGRKARSWSHSYGLGNGAHLPVVVTRKTSLVAAFVDLRGKSSLEARLNSSADLGITARVSKTTMEEYR